MPGAACAKVMPAKNAIFQMGQDPDVLTDRLTLKNGRAFHDPSRPELVFLIPKSRTRRGWIRMGDEFGAIVYMARGDPLLALDIDCGNILTLLPKSTAVKPKKKLQVCLHLMHLMHQR
jgi:hypothetical protein